MTTPGYRHIIWDWNGTLLDDAAECLKVLNDLLARRGLATIDLTSYRKTFDFPVIDFYRGLGFNFDNESYDAVADEYIAGYTACVPHCFLQPGARDVLEHFQQAGLTQSVLSAYHQQRLEEAIVHFGLEAYFLRLVGLNDYLAHSKVENGRRWLRELPHDSREVLLIGDTLHDVEVAREMGVDGVLLTTGHQNSDRLRASGIACFDSLPAIADYVLHENT